MRVFVQELVVGLVVLVGIVAGVGTLGLIALFIAQWFEDHPGWGNRLSLVSRRVLKFALFLMVAWYTGHMFYPWFVGS